MAKLRQIAQLGAPILRTQAEVVNIHTDDIQPLIDDMLATLAESNGVGIAAPQIYESLRIVIIASKPSPRYPNAPTMEPIVMLNPSYQALTDEIKKDWEGCLSIPGIRACVPRYQSIEVSYTDREGRSQQQHFDDFIARVFQHEYDHLNGLVYLDRVENNRDIIAEKEFLKLVS